MRNSATYTSFEKYFITYEGKTEIWSEMAEDM